MSTDFRRPDLVSDGEGDQRRDVDIWFKTVIWIGVAIAITTLGGYGITALYVENLIARPYPADRPPAPMAAANRRVVPPGVRLQTHPEADLEAMISEQKKTIESFEWLDQEQSMARVSIDRAMDLLISKELEPVAEDEQEGTP